MMKDIMIDIETLGTTPDSVILSIAAVYFDRYTGETGFQPFYYQQINPKQKNRSICSDTLAWWSKQSAGLLRSSISGQVLLWRALSSLGEFVDDDSRVWSQGTDFDFSILQHAFVQHSFPAPWKYNNKRDTRTVYDVYNFDPKTIKREGVHHDALHDCYHQIECVVAAMNSGGSKETDGT